MAPELKTADWRLKTTNSPLQSSPHSIPQLSHLHFIGLGHPLPFQPMSDMRLAVTLQSKVDEHCSEERIQPTDPTENKTQGYSQYYEIEQVEVEANHGFDRSDEWLSAHLVDGKSVGQFVW